MFYFERVVDFWGWVIKMLSSLYESSMVSYALHFLVFEEET